MGHKNKKHNALKHGAHASEVLLWSEKYNDYDALRVALAIEYFPNGSPEQYHVDNLLDLLWRRRRLERHERITTQKRLDKIRLDNDVAFHIANLRGLAPGFEGAATVERVEELLATLSPFYKDNILARWPVPSGKNTVGQDVDPNTWGAQIAKGLLSLEERDRNEAADEFLAAFDLREFDQALARIERLDAMIERNIKRLWQLKAQKQMHRQLEPKLINATPAADDGRSPGDRQAT